MADDVTTVFRWEQDADGIVLLTIDDPDAKVNTVNDAYVRDLEITVNRLEAEVDSIKGVILRSGKSSFLAGGDLKKLVHVDESEKQEFINTINHRKMLLRRLELLRTPVVAAVNGPALGGGLELALACHHRVIIDDGRAIVGLPEVGLGLMPGAGGVVRTARRLGLAVALEELILSGRRISPHEALELGVIDTVVNSRDEALQASRAWILQHPGWLSPHVDGPIDPEATYPLPPISADPARRRVVEVAIAAMRTDIETALRVETDGFADLVVGLPAKMSIQTVFFDTTALRSDARARASADGEAPVIHCHSHASFERAQAAGWAKIVSLLGPDAAGDAASDGFHIDAGAGYPRRAWLPEDRVDDGQRLFEYEDDGSQWTAEAVAVLARRGVLPLALRAPATSFSEVMRVALRDAVEEATQAAASPADVARALAWAGIDASALLPAVVLDAAPAADDAPQSERIAGDILDRVASEAERFGRDGALVRPHELDVASVRFGGFPAWAGGAARWRQRREATGTEPSSRAEAS